MTTDRDFDSTAYGRGYKDGKRDAAAEIARLRERLEIDPTHPYDGIYCRDETIRLQDIRIARLKAEVERKNAALTPFTCKCRVKGEGAGGTCTTGTGECSSWNARAALTPSQEPRT